LLLKPFALLHQSKLVELQKFEEQHEYESKKLQVVADSLNTVNSRSDPASRSTITTAIGQTFTHQKYLCIFLLEVIMPLKYGIYARVWLDHCHQ